MEVVDARGCVTARREQSLSTPADKAKSRQRTCALGSVNALAPLSIETHEGCAQTRQGRCWHRIIAGFGHAFAISFLAHSDVQSY